MFWYPKDEDYNERDADGVTLRDFLAAYDPNKYERPAVTVDNLIYRRNGGNLELLLIRRGRHPSYGMLALPGGFIEMSETLEQAAARELMEETGLTGIATKQLGAYGEPGRDPRMRVISVAYYCVIPMEIEPAAGDDASEASFYRVSVSKNLNNLETIYELTFENGENRASAKVSEISENRRIIASEIASDHAIMILDSLERLGFIENM